KEKEIDKKTFEYNYSILEAEKEKLGKETLDNLINKRKLIEEKVIGEIKLNNKNKNFSSFEEFKKTSKSACESQLNLPCIDPCDTEEEVDRKKKTISEKLVENIKNIFFRDVSHVDSYRNNFALGPLVKWGRMRQTSNDEKAPKLPRMRLRGYFTEFSFTIILNATSKEFGNFKLNKPPGPFIITLTFLASSRINDKWEVMNSIDYPVDTNEKTKEVQNFFVYGILSFGCKKGTGGFSPNIAWIVTVTVDSKSLQNKIENTIQLNESVLKDELANLEDMLFFRIEPILSLSLLRIFLIINYGIVLFGYDTNMDSLYNLRLTGGVTLQQLIDAIKSEAPINPHHIVKTQNLTKILLHKY
ncbi:25396_t:CDS:2, partial [Dentiscutata erythropus]